MSNFLTALPVLGYGKKKLSKSIRDHSTRVEKSSRRLHGMDESVQAEKSRRHGGDHECPPMSPVSRQATRSPMMVRSATRGVNRPAHHAFGRSRTASGVRRAVPRSGGGGGGGGGAAPGLCRTQTLGSGQAHKGVF